MPRRASLFPEQLGDLDDGVVRLERLAERFVSGDEMPDATDDLSGP